jgi:hypothetical protein
MKQLRLRSSVTDYDQIQLNGGLDLLTPTSALRPGYIRDGLNFEQSITGGYSRILGYERTDGRPAPSAAVYQVLTCNITGALAVGNTITGVTSGATGVVISIDTALGLVAFTKSVGAFVSGETLNVAGTPRATVTSLGGVGNGADWDAIQLGLAADNYRADIAAPAGSGQIRGGFFHAGVNYCFRDNAGGTALVLYKETSSGWTVVPFLNEVSFTAGSVAPTIGGTITQGANSATVRGIATQSGTWAGGTAAGRLIITTPAPGNFAAGALTAGGTLTLSGAQTAITMLPGGRVETDKGNLTGVRKVYGWDGVNRAWEFDGTTLIPLTTGATVDKPTHGCVFKDHLFLSFGPILKGSGISTPTLNQGAPYDWTVAAGGAEFNCASDIKCLLRMPGSQAVGAMSISCEESTEILYGTSAADWQKVEFEESAGARAYGGQRLGGQAIVYGDLGVFSIATTQNYGNFLPSTLTLNIRPFTQTRRTLCTASLVNREKSQYRVFFSDGYGLYMTIVNGRVKGSLPVFFPNKVVCAWQGAAADGNETAYFGSDNGFVYRLDSGTSADGASIDAYGTLVFNAQGNARVVKQYRGATFEIQGDGYAEFNVTHELNYGSTERPQGATPQEAIIDLNAGMWDSGLAWDTLTWDGRTLAPNEVPLSGRGVNIALRVESSSAIFSSFTINSIVIHYTPRKARKH